MSKSNLGHIQLIFQATTQFELKQTKSIVQRILERPKSKEWQNIFELSENRLIQVHKPNSNSYNK